MMLRNTAFVTSVVGPAAFTGDSLPKIAVAGRSNVGKSSLINALCNNNKIAYVSRTPGKTRLINLFCVDAKFILADLPGYGFARVSRAEQASWSGMVERFLTGSAQLRLLLHLVDIRHEPSKEDLQMSHWMRHFQIPFQCVLTKADKLSKTQQQQRMEALKQEIPGGEALQMTPFSAKTGQGTQELHQIIEHCAAE